MIHNYIYEHKALYWEGFQSGRTQWEAFLHPCPRELATHSVVTVVVQSLSPVRLFVTPWTAAFQAPLSSTVSQSLLNFMSIELVRLSNHLILCRPFSSCLQSFPASGSFPISWLFGSGGQNIKASASASVLSTNIQDWFPLGWSGWISWQSKGLSRVFSSTTVQKHQFFSAQPSLWSNSPIGTWLVEETIALTIQTFAGKMMSLFVNTLSSFIIALLPRSKHFF